MKKNTEFLFAHWAVPQLKNLRGSKWHTLVERISHLPETAPDALAFSLTMVRVNNCATCTALRYRERGGCASCAQFVLTVLSKESETSLIDRFRMAQREIAHSILTPYAEEKKAA